jgi:DNA-binding transcriptional regulator YiaG
MSETTELLSPASCRAARALLKLSQEELARLANISVGTLRRFELGEGSPSPCAAKQILKALEQEGVLFVGPSREPVMK